MNFAIVGCGFVADLYMAALANHSQLVLCGVWDRNPERLRAFTAYHKVKAYPSLEVLLADPSVQLVANLTNPREHYPVSRASLMAGKHVYSEKPLATELDDARKLVELSEEKGLLITSAPCSVLSETAQTIWKLLREGQIGQPRLVYAELDDGNVAAMNHASWVSASGAPWPAQDEFEVGCTLEHAGYHLTWLTAFFGPVHRMTSFARVVQPDKGIPNLSPAADYATASLEFGSGVVARLTCSIYGAHDHRLRIFGDEGTLGIDRIWDYGAPVHMSRRHKWTHRVEKYPLFGILTGLGPKKVPLVRKPTVSGLGLWGKNAMDFCRGMADMSDALAGNRPPAMSARWALHITEVVLATQSPSVYGDTRTIESRFDPLEPAAWAL
jgi:predicted dehydrogenase